MKNKRGDYCRKCGHWTEPGNELVRWFDDDEDREVWLVFHTDKSVCETNIAADKAEKEAKKQAEAAWYAFRNRFNDAETPEAANPYNEDGAEMLADTRNIYGGGFSIVLTASYVWLVDGNGMDGDNWSYNNMPGAIGRRLPRTEELEAEARRVAALPR